MSDNFVRKDLHDANMAEIRALMAASEARHEKIAAEIHTEVNDVKGELKNINTRIEGIVDTFSVAINNINDRIDDIKNSQSSSLAKWGIAIALFVGVVQVIISVILNFWK